jgi:hypothetical protein
MIHLTCVTGMSEVRDAFVLPLANLTSLHSPGALRGKNVVAMRELLKVAMDNANTLGSAWTHCLKAVSRFDRLYNYAMGFDDVSLFTDDANDGNDGSQAEWSHKKGGSGRLFRKSVKAFGSPAGRSSQSRRYSEQGASFVLVLVRRNAEHDALVHDADELDVGDVRRRRRRRRRIALRAPEKGGGQQAGAHG